MRSRPLIVPDKVHSTHDHCPFGRVHVFLVRRFRHSLPAGRGDQMKARGSAPHGELNLIPLSVAIGRPTHAVIARCASSRRGGYRKRIRGDWSTSSALASSGGNPRLPSETDDHATGLDRGGWPACGCRKLVRTPDLRLCSRGGHGGRELENCAIRRNRLHRRVSDTSRDRVFGSHRCSPSIDRVIS